MKLNSVIEDAADLGPLNDLIGYHLRRASTVVHADFTKVMTDTGIRQVLFGLLSVIAANPRINQGNAGKALGIKRNNMVSLINELIAADLVDRQVDPSDRRAFIFTLTEKGGETIGEAMSRIRDHEDRLLNGFSTEERASFLAFLRRIEPADH